MSDLSAFTLIAAAIAAVISLAKKVPKVREQILGKERMVSVILGGIGAFIGHKCGWLEVAQEGFMGFVTTGAALAAASGVAYEQLLKVLQTGPNKETRITNLEQKDLIRTVYTRPPDAKEETQS